MAGDCLVSQFCFFNASFLLLYDRLSKPGFIEYASKEALSYNYLQSNPSHSISDQSLLIVFNIAEIAYLVVAFIHQYFIFRLLQ